MTLSLSENGLAFIAAREGCVLTMYRDTHAPAMGFGINDPRLQEGDTTTLAKAVGDFVSDAKRRLLILERIFVDLSPSQQVVDAILSLGYNIGMGALQRNVVLVGAVRDFADNPTNRIMRDLAGYQIIRANYGDAGPFNLSRRCREALVLTTGDYGDLSTLKLWPVGTSPRNTPPDPPQLVPMPKFLTGN